MHSPVNILYVCLFIFPFGFRVVCVVIAVSTNCVILVVVCWVLIAVSALPEFECCN